MENVRISHGNTANPFRLFCTGEKGTRTLCKCRLNKTTERDDAVFWYILEEKQVLAVEMFSRAQVVWMRLNCSLKMSKSLLICGLETVPKTSQSIPMVHTSLMRWSGGRWKPKTQSCHEYLAPCGRSRVPHCENHPLWKVPLADAAGNRDGWSPGDGMQCLRQSDQT